YLSLLQCPGAGGDPAIYADSLLPLWRILCQFLDRDSKRSSACGGTARERGSARARAPAALRALALPRSRAGDRRRDGTGSTWGACFRLEHLGTAEKPASETPGGATGSPAAHARRPARPGLPAG